MIDARFAEPGYVVFAVKSLNFQVKQFRLEVSRGQNRTAKTEARTQVVMVVQNTMFQMIVKWSNN